MNETNASDFPFNVTSDYSPVDTDFFIPLAVLFGVVFLISIAGNALVIIAVVRTPKLRTPVSLFFCNLSSADLVFTFLALFSMLDLVMGRWAMGLAFCKFQGAALESAYTVAIFTLSAISAERFRSLRNPRLSRYSTGRTLTIMGTLWVTAVLISSPLLHAYGLNTNRRNRTLCGIFNWPQVAQFRYYVAMTVLSYGLPLLWMAAAYSGLAKVMMKHKEKERRLFDFPLDLNDANRANTLDISTHARGSTYGGRIRHSSRVLVIVSLVMSAFLVLWTPMVVVRLIRLCGFPVQDVIWRISQLMALSSCAINPVIYAWKSRQLRTAFTNTISSFLARKLDKGTDASSSGHILHNHT